MRLARLFPWLQREAEFLVGALLIGRADRAPLRALAERGLNWPRVERLARANAALGPVWRTVLDLGLEERIEPRVRERMREYYENNAAQNALQLAELARVVALLREKGIEAIALKGAALLLAHYPCLGSRQMDDLDLLVRPEQVETAGALLDESGFSLMRYGGRVLDSPAGHHVAGRLSPAGVLVELHLALPYQGARPTLDEVWEGSRLVEFQRTPIRIPAPEHLFAIACQHALGGHADSAPCLVRHLVDVHVLGAEAGAPLADDPTVRASLQLLRSAEGERGLPAEAPRAVDLFLPTLTGADVAKRLELIGGALRDPGQLRNLLIAPEHLLRARYGPGWRPWLNLKRMASLLLPHSMRKW